MRARALRSGAPLACLLAGLPLAAPADDRPSIYPPAHCAALWEGYADVLGDEGERALAARFRAASVRVIGEAETDRLIAERRPWMRDLLTAYVRDGDEQSEELFETLLRNCARLEGDLRFLEQGGIPGLPAR
ncbi:hypothetical protein [Rubellimicrobium roseum]|uniref:Uncharacterized protein n=1 Tax=Rubellimicrobium roseum TaxID=687525 RepID=A0A5C4NN73_9RHOB|nr:hypothetical protein [Rubellimicrobium roseum]TNC73829.1 hypothetical protein FHG71_04980 [Rubellimicrobium roseum]